jgi:hypothetical protein
MNRFVFSALLLSLAPVAQAELIDPFSASQGPFTVGPGEEISEAEGILETDSVLGGFRVFVPGLDDEAPAGSSITASVAGGEFICEIDIAGGSSDSGGGCSSGYDRGNSELFDFSSAQAFEIDVSDVSGNIALGVNVFGPNENGAAILLDSVQPGTLTLPLGQLLPLTATPVDLAAVDTVLVTVVNLDGGSGRIAIDRFGTSGPIGNGEAVPGDEEDDDLPPDAELRDEIYGNFYNPLRSGEGIQLTLEADGETFILTYYTYLDGEQVWLIGTGVLVDGKIRFEDMSITDGADYGGAFDPDDVNVMPWGEIEMDFISCNRAVLQISPELAEFDAFVVEMQRITMRDCAASGPPPTAVQIAGNWYDPDRSGEGFQLAYEEGRYVLTFYTYRNGEQVWMIGTGDRSGNTLSFPEVYVTQGGDFGGRFDADDVSNTLFGSIEITLDGCNLAEIVVDAVLSGFADQTLDVRKIVPATVCLS